MKSENQVDEILKVINLILEQLSMLPTNFGYVKVENMQDIIEKQKLNQKFQKIENSFLKMQSTYKIIIGIKAMLTTFIQTRQTDKITMTQDVQNLTQKIKQVLQEH